MKQKKMVGVSIVEVILAITVLLFVSYAGLLLLGTTSSKGVLMSKKIDLFNELEGRVNSYSMTGEFDNSADGDMVFSEQEYEEHIIEFDAKNDKLGLSVIKRAFQVVLDNGAGMTGIACSAVVGGHCACTESGADRLQRCMEIIGTTDQNDSRVSSCQAQHGGNNPNEAGYQCKDACSSGLNASCMKLS